ncbi:lamin tail domain-containing protein, partial [Patescibacteria group bacterium]|nr:lamin tail domain-containing protein [Patescibacteria group bacterium]
MKNHFLIVFFLLLFCLIPFKSLAANLDIVGINEIAWMGTTNSANDEWVELYNNTDNSVNLDGWQLIAQDGTPKITLSGIIPANGFYLLERTNDETVPGISADLIYKGALGNNGENLKLYDSSGNLIIIDEINHQDGWPAGDNDTKQTMERSTTGWQTSENPGGTPKSKNSAGAVVK